MGEYLKTLIVDSPLGKKYIDSTGAPISGIRMDTTEVYGQIPTLLQLFINNNDHYSWKKITKKINYIYANIDYALTELDKETCFSDIIQSEISSGKKLLFKPNLVAPNCIDEITHGEGPGAVICTEWPLVAALMRWFHDKLDISYHQMALGEASTSTFALAYAYTRSTGKTITTEAVIEGRSGNFYGGWGFFFVRKYLAEQHPAFHEDHPMNGYDDSTLGRFFPPGRAGNRLMVYDLNKLEDDTSKARTIDVPDGVNFKKITLHKAVIGGSPYDYDDISNYPGCVLVNVPKLKMHAQDLLTNAIKNLGIGLYPSQCADSSQTAAYKYAYASASIPIWKGKLPHSPWVFKIDDNTNLPAKDASGNYIATKTAGFSGTQTDVIKAVQSQDVFMLHIVDAINMINISHDPDGFAVRVPEGYVWTSLDCVALDLFCARYCFKTVPMSKALKLKRENNWPTEFVQYVPLARMNGPNISTKTGFDSPLFRYDLYHFAEERGIGKQQYYIVGWDTITKMPLVSLKGHLGRIDAATFLELMTETLYYNRTTIIHDLQNTILSYLKACDAQTGSQVFEELIELFDENKDGVIDYDEKGRGIETAVYGIMAHAQEFSITSICGTLKTNFVKLASFIKYSARNWNLPGHDFAKERFLIQKAELAYKMSQAKVIHKDLFMPEMTFGMGMWPSWLTVTYILNTNNIYGSQSPKDISLTSLYGNAFQYADKIQNAGTYTGSIDEKSSHPDCINNYFEAISQGAVPLNFTLYVPIGYENLEDIRIPNVTATNDPQKTFTVHFKDIW